MIALGSGLFPLDKFLEETPLGIAKMPSRDARLMHVPTGWVSRPILILPAD